MKLVLSFALIFYIFFSHLSSAYSAITVGTYNLHQMTDLEGLARDLQALENVDVWCFQEVMSSGKDDVVNLIKILGKDYKYILNYPVAKENSQDSTLWEGHAIVSRYPIVDMRVIPLNHSGPKNRAALVAWIEFRNQRLMVVNTDHEVDPIKIGYEDRKKQLESLLFGIDQISFRGPSLILGDFNPALSWPNILRNIDNFKEVSLINSFLSQRGWVPATSATTETYTFNVSLFYQQLDLIFYKNMLFNFKSPAWQRFDQREGSDHYPIFVFLDLF